MERKKECHYKITKRNLDYLFNETEYFSGVDKTDKEVGKGTDATLTCTVTGLTEAATVIWISATGGDSIADDDKFKATAGAYADASNSQEFVLAVKASETTADKQYFCAVTSTEWEKVKAENAVDLNVFGAYSANL